MRNNKYYLIAFFICLAPLLRAQEMDTLMNVIHKQPDSLLLTPKVDSLLIQDTISIQQNQMPNEQMTSSFSDSTSKQNISIDTFSSKKKEKPPYLHQLRFGIDVLRLGMNFGNPTSQGYNFSGDYLLRSSWYLVAEAGYGKGQIDYPNLKYTSNSAFIKLGGDKSLLLPVNAIDLDYVFFGFRYGLGFGQRGETWYKTSSLFGSEHEGTIAADNFIAHWGEMNAGIRTEFWKGIYAGWNFRAKFLLNGKSFANNVSPNYIAGYGSADKSTIFDFSIFVMYAIKWTK